MEICRTSVEFVGLTLAHGQYDVDSYVQQQLASFPRVANVRKLQQALGGLNFVRGFVPKMHAILVLPRFPWRWDCLVRKREHVFLGALAVMSKGFLGLNGALFSGSDDC